MPSSHALSSRFVETTITGDSVLREVLDAVTERMRYDSAHDPGHLLRVASWTLRLLDEIPGGQAVERRLAIAAALLHDIVNLPKTDSRRESASEQSARVAAKILAGCRLPDDQIKGVCDAIRDHSYTRGAIPRSPLGIALQDADRLEALGVIGTFRCIATGVHFGAAFVDSDDPWADRRPLDDKAYSVDHFFTKLLILPPTLLTHGGRTEAKRRAARMIALLRGLGEEIETPFVQEVIGEHLPQDFQADGFQ